MTINSKATKKDRLIGALRMRGMTVKQFAERYGFSYDLVRMAIGRHYGGIYSTRRGNTKAIIEKLIEVTGEEPNEGVEAA